MKRREFLRAMLLLPLAALTRVAPARWVRAIRARCYPGPVVPLNVRDAAHPGPWAG